jgi:uncharacterized lipoprotein YmbA
MKTQCGVAKPKFEARNPKLELRLPKAGESSDDRNSNDTGMSKIKTVKALWKASGNRPSFVQRFLVHKAGLLLALAVCLSGCAGKSAPSKFYVLSSLPEPALSASEGAVIAVFPVVMADYLDRPQIVTRVSQNEINLNEFDRWAGPLDDNFSRVLVQNLSTLLNSAKVLKTTENAGVPVAVYVGIEVMQFDGTLGGDVVLAVRWALFGKDGKTLLLAKRSSFKEPTEGATYEALVAAESRAVAALSREIASAIKSSPGGS